MYLYKSLSNKIIFDKLVEKSLFQEVRLFPAYRTFTYNKHLYPIFTYQQVLELLEIL